MRRGSSLLFRDDGEPRLVIPGLAVVIASFVVALALLAALSRPRTPEARAESLLHSGKPAQAERIYLQLVRQHPDVETVMQLLNAHAMASALATMRATKPEPGGDSVGDLLPNDEAPLSEPEIDAVVNALPPDVATIARYARAVTRDGPLPEDVVETIENGAAREPPMPYANELLARRALADDKIEIAAVFLEREGLAFPERRHDVDESLQLRMREDDWETVHDRLDDPRVAAAAGAHVKYDVAVHDRDWQSALRLLPSVWRPRFSLDNFLMSAITALGWFFFCARLGKMGARPKFRLPMYLLAFVLGVASVGPTVALIAVEEAKLHLVETGDAARDILFFVFGVGLREEASKILMFLPLLPLLRRYGDKLDVLVCGAIVGLGFAAEENLGYLAANNLATGLGRFLTANFFHMAMTGTLASAVDDFVSDRERNAPQFMRTSLFVVAIHGAYDFLISHSEYGGGYFAMTAFVVLTRLFLDAVDVARRRADRGLTPLHAFVFAVALVTGVSLAFACAAVGPKAALLVTGSGLLGEAVIVYVFVRQLRTM